MDKTDISSLKLEKANRSNLADLINESEHAFMPPATNPDETASDLFKYFERRFINGQDHIYQPPGYRIGREWISYIVALYYKANIISIGPMYISEKYRGLGLGNRQVADFIDYARRRGFDSVYTKTWGGNEVSRAIFDNSGFRIVGSKQNDRFNGDSTVKYLLDL